MKKVLLTGATGFIGRHTIPVMIENGYEVHAVLHTGQAFITQEPRLLWHECSLLNVDQQRSLVEKVKPTHLLHFAWYTTPGKYWTSLENLRWVQASLDLLMNFVNQGGRRAVLAGTCAEYDWSYGYCCEEVTPTQPSTLYGSCKHSLQEILRHLSRQTGLSSAWGRIFFPYGPQEHPARLVPTVVKSLLKAETARCSHGEQIRDFLFVKDVASAFVALLESSIEGPVNIASGHPVTLKDIINKIAEKMNRQDLIQLGALSTPANEPPLIVGNIRRLSEEVGWIPKYDLDRGLEQTIEWWKNVLCVNQSGGGK